MFQFSVNRGREGVAWGWGTDRWDQEVLQRSCLLGRVRERAHTPVFWKQVWEAGLGSIILCHLVGQAGLEGGRGN